MNHMNSTVDNSPQALQHRIARSLSNAQLATALDNLSRRGVAKEVKVAVRAEAARRLRWQDVYVNASGKRDVM